MGRPVADVQAAIENTGNIEVAKLETDFLLWLLFPAVRRCLVSWVR